MGDVGTGGGFFRFIQLHIGHTSPHTPTENRAEVAFVFLFDSGCDRGLCT